MESKQSQSAAPPDLRASDPGGARLGAIVSTRAGCFGAGGEIRLREAPVRERRRMGRNLIRPGGQAMRCFCEPRRGSEQTGGNFSRLPAQQSENCLALCFRWPMGPTAPPDRLGPRRRANIARKFARSVDIKKAPSNHDADAGSNRLVAAARRSAILTLQGRHDELSVGLLPFLAQRRRQMKASTVHATFRFVFAIRMRFAQWAKHPGRKSAATNSCRQSYNLWFMPTMRWLRKSF